MFSRLTFTLLLVVSASLSRAQEYSSMRHYENETEMSELAKGCWLKKDRLKNSDTWKDANRHNLAIENADNKYTTPEQIRDFYVWFDACRIEQGHEIRWIGLASIAAGQLARVENGFLRTFIVRNKEVVNFVREGCREVFAYSFPKMRTVFFSGIPITGSAATAWDEEHGLKEQCEILDDTYTKLSAKALKRLNKMARGKGIFRLGVTKQLRYDGDLLDCQKRFEHGVDKLLPYYLKKQ